MRNCGDYLIRESWSHGGLFMILLTLQGYYGNPSANQAYSWLEPEPIPKQLGPVLVNELLTLQNLFGFQSNRDKL